MRILSRRYDSDIQQDVLEIIADDAEDTVSLYHPPTIAAI